MTTRRRIATAHFLALTLAFLALAGCSTLARVPSRATSAQVTGSLRLTSTTRPAMPLAPPALTARAAELYDVSTNTTLLALNADTEAPMASTTKIMTAVVALTYGSLDQPITVGADAVAIESQGTSVAGLRLGETLTLRELLYCLMLPSGDDAAVAIADGIGGSQSGFVALMNLEAGLLGLSHTHYANPHGLDQQGHYTSASDLVRLAAYAMGSPTFAHVVGTARITLPQTATHHLYILTNTDELLPGEPFAFDGAIGVKTGYTGGAGYCLVFEASRPAGVLIGVVMGEPVYTARFTDAATLLTWGYSQLAPAAATPAATPSVTPTVTPTATK